MSKLMTFLHDRLSDSEIQNQIVENELHVDKRLRKGKSLRITIRPLSTGNIRLSCKFDYLLSWKSKIDDEDLYILQEYLFLVYDNNVVLLNYNTNDNSLVASLDVPTREQLSDEFYKRTERGIDELASLYTFIHDKFPRKSPILDGHQLSSPMKTIKSEMHGPFGNSLAQIQRQLRDSASESSLRLEDCKNLTREYWSILNTIREKINAPTISSREKNTLRHGIYSAIESYYDIMRRFMKESPKRYSLKNVPLARLPDKDRGEYLVSIGMAKSLDDVYVELTPEQQVFHDNFRKHAEAVYANKKRFSLKGVPPPTSK